MFVQAEKSQLNVTQAEPAVNQTTRHNPSAVQTTSFIDKRAHIATLQKAKSVANDSALTIQLRQASTVIQKKDKHYWVVTRGDKQYVGTFKNHAEANSWWHNNKGDWDGYTFGQGSSRSKYR